MRSKISFFDKGLCLNYIRRYWPLWLAWLAMLMLLLPASLPGMLAERDQWYAIENVNRHLLQSGEDLARFSAFAVIPVVLAMYSHLYNSRGCSMINSLPVRRETVFLTGFFTGLVPMLLSVVITAAVTALMLMGEPQIELSHLRCYLGAGLLSITAFYGIAVFCAMLTGSAAVFPAVYLLLNVAPMLAEGAVKSVINQFVYGFNYGGLIFRKASPIAEISTASMIASETHPVALDAAGKQIRYVTEYSFEGMGLLAVYCVVGLLLALFALRLYKRRAMESVGDVVAIPVLRPIFKYALSFGVAFCFAALVFTGLFERLTRGTAEAVTVLVLLLVGAFLGYFAAEMLLQKTLRVFRGRWKGYIAVAVLLIAFVAVWETDMTGYERRVPDVEDIERVTLHYSGETELKESENLALTTELHRQIISRKAENENADLSENVNICYTLKNGREINRSYSMADETAQHKDESSNILALGRLLNVREAIDNRLATELPVTEENIVNAYVSAYHIDEEGIWHNQEIKLSSEQAVEFYEDCILADAGKSHLGHIWTVRDMDYYNFLTNTSFSFGIVDVDSSEYESERRRYYSDFKIYTDAENCCRWLAENTDINILPIAEAEPEQMLYDTDIHPTAAVAEVFR